MKKILKDIEFYTFTYGFTFACEIGKYMFNLNWHWCRFQFGGYWWFNKWKIQELNISIGFVDFNWTRILP